MNNNDMEVGVPVGVIAAYSEASARKGVSLGYYFTYEDADHYYPNHRHVHTPTEVVKLSDGRVVEVGKPVHVVWDADEEASKREAALSKLTPEERVMLGLGV